MNSAFVLYANDSAQDEEVLILFASSNISAKNVMTGYELGGNSYIRKPFMPRELDAHIKALMKLKGSRRVIDDTNLIKFGTYILDIEHCILKNEKTGDVVLTTLESSLLETLCRSMGETVKRVDLLKTFWNAKDDNKYYASRSLDVFITKLRKKILADPNLEIRTQRGVGIGLFLK
ncbi:response regulator transcription factor [uncultured Bacteroides sp.]|uniref:response regulator transcription factor n=1 Tax=uncultured Bacteroides sp. TaxID=162156 RepID=UPI002AAAC872|nr:response regulator transcription factor [uncultured Bacteroides sp.]